MIGSIGDIIIITIYTDSISIPVFNNNQIIGYNMDYFI